MPQRDARNKERVFIPVRHGRVKRFRSAATALKVAALSLSVILISTASVAAIAVNNLSQQVHANSVDISGGTGPQTPHVGAFVGGFNMLIVGTDNDQNQGDAFGKREGTLNDVNILLHVAADQKSAVAISFPRDLLVDFPKCTNPKTGDKFDVSSRTPLNNAFGRGGIACVTATLEKLTGLEIPYAGTISFNGVIAMTNAVGGVPVCLDEAIYDGDSGLDLPAGTSVIAGKTALSFLRNRHGVGDGSDLGRIGAQQSYLSSLVRTLKSTDTLGNIPKLYNLSQAAVKNMTFSTTLASIDSLVSLALALKNVDTDKLTFVQYPSGSSVDYPGKVIPKRELAQELMSRIQADEPVVLAGSNSGPGAKTAEPEKNKNPLSRAPIKTTTPPTPTNTASPGTAAAPTPQPTPQPLEGVTGQRADQTTCAVAN